MIYQNIETENTQNQFSNAVKELQCGKLLCKANITKNCGIPAFEIFQFLLLLVFQGKNLFRFLNETSYNWKKFLLLLAVKVTSVYDTLTRPERVKVLVLDDSVIKRNRYQKMPAGIDCRSNGYKAQKESLMAKTDAAVPMIGQALNAGIQADYVLMDT